MARTILRVVLVVSLFGAGWIAAKAQTSAPTFELEVDAPGGETTVLCVRGCRLAWVQRGVNPNATPQPTFKYSCTPAQVRCGSGAIGGWVD
jgi:hypothetical protein